MVEPKVLINTNSIVKKGCIISAGAMVDHDVLLEECIHMNAEFVCQAGDYIAELRKLEAGEIVLDCEKRNLNAEWVKNIKNSSGEKQFFLDVEEG